MFRRDSAIPTCVLTLALALTLASSAGAASTPLAAADQAVAKGLVGFDAYMERLVKDWNVPGIGVAVVARDQVVLAKGWGYRDYGKMLPFTPRNVVPIASNTKLFTSVAAGLLVEEGKLAWHLPVKQFVPSIRLAAASSRSGGWAPSSAQYMNGCRAAASWTSCPRASARSRSSSPATR